MRSKILYPVIILLTALVLLSCPNPVAPVTPVTDTIINIATIPGVTVPVTGATPVPSITETDQYTGVVEWSPTVSNMFISNITYTATITLTAKAGYTLTVVAADFFTVAGTTSDTNPVNSGVVTASFPVTTANLVAVTDYTGTGVGTLKAVQGGTFNNGTANMTVSSFRMSQHEVTGEQYAAVMGVADPSSFSTVIDNPVEMVTWYDSVEFCNKLSIKEGLTPVYTISGRTPATGYPINSATVSADWSANGYRLPTEAEWRFAARGGNSSHNYTYAGSDDLDKVAWNSENSEATTHKVGTKDANELFLHDMSGNVWEWCWDWDGSYPADTALTDYRGAASGDSRIDRGGNWNNGWNSCVVDTRSSDRPDLQTSRHGFRVVRP